MFKKTSNIPVTQLTYLTNPTHRDAHYQDPETKKLNVAQYLIDLDNAKQIFKFCGSHKFQLQLSSRLRSHLAAVAEEGALSTKQPVVFNKEQFSQIENYNEFKASAKADNVQVFHGREVRNSPDANGGQGKILHMSFAGGDDPEGWT